MGSLPAHPHGRIVSSVHPTVHTAAYSAGTDYCRCAETLKEATAIGVKAEHVPCDVTDADAVAQAVTKVRSS